MKKITTILSPLVLLATTALAQDSTCILQPSCSQLGYTSSETDCGTQKVLRCPFDVSQVACVGGGSNSGGSGGSGDDYNPNDPNNELGDVIALKFVLSSSGNIKFTYGGGSIFVDCGEGTIVGGSASSSGTITCTYRTAGTYTVKLSGDFTYYGGSSLIPTSLIKLDKSGITKMSNVCGDGTNGVVPPLPSTLKDATSMFEGCTVINSPYPQLPEGLEIADYMFYGISNMSGDVSLPSSLKSAIYMFNGNSKLNAVTGLENTKITEGLYMFGSSGITSVSGLPSTLTNGNRMFYGSSLPTLPNLPDSLTNGFYMFYGCINMEGTVNSLPSSLINGVYMFRNTPKLTGSPAKPTGLDNNCKNLGSSENSQGSCYNMFNGSGVSVDWDD